MPPIPLHRDRTTGWLVGTNEDPELFLPPAALIERGAQPQMILTLVQGSVVQVLDEVVNRWPKAHIMSARWQWRVQHRVDAVAQIARALAKQGICDARPMEHAGRQPASLALACISLARKVARGLAISIPTAEVSPQPALAACREADVDHEDLLKRLASLPVQSQQSIDGLYVYGSIRRQETTAFSDIDAAVLLAPPTEHDPVALARAARALNASSDLLFARDPLQHHGWLVLAPFLLDAYPGSLLPVASLNEGLMVFGPSVLTVRLLNCRTMARRHLWTMVQVFRKLRCRYASDQVRSLHDDKLLLSQFMLLPALYCQATGRSVSKRASFGLARGELPGLGWETMDLVSSLRLAWTQPNLGRHWRFVAHRLGPWETQALWRKLSRSNRDSSGDSRIPSKWLEPMADFAEEILAASERNYRQTTNPQT